MFVLASFLGGLGGALVTPVRTIVPGMDTEIIVEAFIVVVIGGLGSFWGTFLGSLIYGQVLSFGILLLPALLDLLGVRPHGRRPHHPPLGPPRPAPEVATGESVIVARPNGPMWWGVWGRSGAAPPQFRK